MSADSEPSTTTVRPSAGCPLCWRAGFAVSVVVQVLVLYLPRVPAPPGPGELDKVVHALVFAAVAWTGLRIGLPSGPLIGLLLANAVVSEVYQGLFLSQRTGDPLDTAADAIGVLLGWLPGPASRSGRSG